MDISIEALSKICKSENIDDVNNYLMCKNFENNELDDAKFLEVKSIYNFFSNNCKGITHISLFLEFFKHEHDALLFLKKKEKIIIIDFEFKRNGELEKVRKQVGEHIVHIGSRISKKRYKLYGVSVISDKCHVELFEYNSKNEKIIRKNCDINHLLKVFAEKKYEQIIDSSMIINEFNGSINDIISICKNNFIKFTSEEEHLMNWIEEEIEKNDFLIIDAPGGTGKTTIILSLFFNKYLDKSQIFFNNYRIHSLMLNEHKINKNISFFEDRVDKKGNNEILLIDEAQRLTIFQILSLKEKFKKIIMFGDKHQCFDTKYFCDYSKLKEKLEPEYNVKYKKFISDTIRRSSKEYISLIQHIFNPKKYNQVKHYSSKHDFKINIVVYDDVNEFLKKYKNINGNKKIFTEKKYLRQICNKWEIKNAGLYELIGKENPSFAFDENYSKIGTAYNAFSFEIDYVFIIVNSSLEEIEEDKLIFNELFTLATRAKKELHLYFHNTNIKQYYKICEEVKNYIWRINHN